MTHEPVDFKVSGSFDWGSLPTFTRKLHEISTGESDCFVLNLEGLKFCEPVGLSCLAAGMHYLRLREQKCIEIKRPKSCDVSSYLDRLGLFEMLGETDIYPFQRRDPSGRFVELTRLTSASQIPKATSDLCDVFSESLGLDSKAKSAVDTILSEVTENVFHHAQSPTGAYLCCQSYPDRLSAAIVDLGDGIRVRLSDTEELQSRLKELGGPLAAAITRGITSRPAHNSGYGLALTSGLVKQNSGELCIHSQRDRLTQDGENIFEYPDGERWPGTVIYLTVFRDRLLDSERLYAEVWPIERDDEIDFLDK